MIIKIQKRTINTIYITLLLFLILFAPPVIPKINLNIPLFFISLFFIKVKYYDCIISFLKNKYVFKFLKYYIAFMLMLFSYIFFRELFNDVTFKEQIITIYRFLLLCPVYITNLFFVFCIAKRMKMNYQGLMYCVIYAFIFQSFLSIISFVFPSIRSVFVSMMVKSESNSVLFSDWQLERRFYGLANNMLDTFGFGVGIAAILPLILDKKIKIKNVILSFLVLISTILNSRTGLLIYGIGLGLCLIYSIISSNNIFYTLRKYIEILFLSIVIIIILKILLELFSPKTLLWIEEGFEGLISVITGNANNATDSMGKLFDLSYWYFPNNAFDILFGSGHVVYGGIAGFKSTDVGYINDIWLIGIIGLPFLYFPFLYLYYSLYTKNSLEEKFIALFFSLSFFVFNIKGMVIAYNTGMALQLCIIYLCFLFKKSHS